MLKVSKQYEYFGRITTSWLIGIQAGVSCTVYEKETPETYVTRPREWGMTLHWGWDHLYKYLPSHLREKIRGTYCNPHRDIVPGVEDHLPVSNGKTGEIMVKWPADNPIRVSRRKLRELFAEGLDVQV